MTQQDERKNRKWCAIVLAAGYGTRLAKDIIESGDHSLAPLVNLPKPLLPICNVPLLDYWLNIFRKQSDIISDVMVVTNQKFYSQLLHWASTRGLPSFNIVNDGSFSNDSRLGAACDINLIINSKQSIIQGNDVFIVAGDTLFYEDFDLRTFLQSIPDGCGGTVYYDISNPEERSKRGIIEIDTLTNKIINFLEKPNVNETDSTKACPACYSYPSNYYNMIPSFISETADLPLEARDAPGKLLSWFLLKQNAEIYSHKISGRFDIGSLQDYIHTTNHFNHNLYKKTLTLPKYVEQLCYARVGLLGNPSDGFHGKTISFSLENFYATVTITSPTNESDTTIELVPHPIYDRSKYKSLDNLLSSTLTNVIHF
jgi:glucuronokinase